MTRKNFKHLFANPQYKDDLADIFGGVFLEEEPEKKQYIKDFLFLEMLYLYHMKVFSVQTLKPKDPISMFSKHEEFIYQGVPFDQGLLNRTVFLMKNVYHEKDLDKVMELYFSVSSDFRIFELEEGEVVSHSPKYFARRDKLYELILQDDQVIAHIKKEKPFVEQKHSEFLFLKPKKNDEMNQEKKKTEKDKEKEKENKKEKDYKVRDAFNANKLTKNHYFPLTRLIERRIKEKKGVEDLNQYLPLPSTYEEMGRHYPKNFQSMEVFRIHNRVIDEDPSSFYFDGRNHVLAPTGAGKTTLTHGLAYSLCRKGKKKFLIITNNTTQTMEEKHKLEKLGLKVAPIIGSTNLDSHQRAFIQNTAGEYEDGFDFIKKRKDDLEVLNGRCLIKPFLPKEEGLAFVKQSNQKEEEKEKEEKNPCQSIWIKNQKKPHVCPMYGLCSAHYRYRKMLTADVWIGTPEAFANSYAPYQFDQYERSFLELGVLWADVLVVDEADNIQKRMDSLFIEKLYIVANDKEKIHTMQYFADYLFENIPNVIKSKTEDGFVGEYIEKTTELQNVFHYVYGQIINEEHMKEYLKTPFTAYRLIRDWFASFCVKTEERIDEDPSFLSLVHRLQEFYSSLAKQTEEPADLLLEDDLNLLHIKLKSVSTKSLSKEYGNELKQGEIEKFLHEIETKVGFQLKRIEEVQMSKRFGKKMRPYETKEKENLRSKRFEFILFFLKAEALVHFLRTRYDNFINRAELRNSQTFKKDYIYKTNRHPLYTPNALTDTFAVYRLIETEENGIWQQSIQLNEYKGIGRNLMTNLHTVFEGIEQKKPPALLFLSATSDIPHSSYFGLDVTPNWLLENKNQKKQKINMTICGVMDETGGEVDYYKLSGAKDPKKLFKGLAKKLVHSGYLDNMHRKHRDMLKNEVQDIKEKAQNEPEGEKKEDYKKQWSTMKKEQIPCIGLVVKSYDKAEWVAEGLREAGFDMKEVKVLHSPNANYGGEKIKKESYHVSINEVEMLWKHKPKIFVMVRESMARGYNILAGENSNRSFLRTICFFERPHPVPEEFNDVVMLIHAQQPHYREVLAENQKRFFEAEKYLNYQAYQDLHRIFNTGGTSYSNMALEEQKPIAANELVMTFQTSGRGTRSVPVLNVVFFDVQIAPETFGQNATEFIDQPHNSMMALWKDLVVDSSDDLVKRVQSVWVDALSNIQIDYID